MRPTTQPNSPLRRVARTGIFPAGTMLWLVDHGSMTTTRTLTPSAPLDIPESPFAKMSEQTLTRLLHIYAIVIAAMVMTTGLVSVIV